MATFLHPSFFKAYNANIEYGNTGVDTDLPLTEKEMAQLTHFLSWLQKNEIPVLFYYYPRAMNDEEKGRISFVESLFEDYGFPYINSLRENDNIGLDNTTDYQNNGHLNYWGRIKMTKFISEYILANFDIPDHRDDPLFNKWNEAYEEYLTMVDEFLSDRES